MGLLFTQMGFSSVASVRSSAGRRYLHCCSAGIAGWRMRCYVPVLQYEYYSRCYVHSATKFWVVPWYVALVGFSSAICLRLCCSCSAFLYPVRWALHGLHSFVPGTWIVLQCILYSLLRRTEVYDHKSFYSSTNCQEDEESARTLNVLDVDGYIERNNTHNV